jgi:hypothetical protein
MTKLGRSTTIGCLFIGALVIGALGLAATSWAQTRPPIVEQIAKTYGLDSFGQIEAIRYTFNAELPGVNLSRSWVWQPKTGQISYEGKDKDGKPVKVTYVQSRLDGEPANVKDEIDPAFYNDNYWLLLPLHVYWDSNVGTLRRARNSRRGNDISPGRSHEAERRRRQLGRLSESWPSPDLNRPPRDGRRQAAASLFVECCRQAGGIGQLGERTIGNGRQKPRLLPGTIRQPTEATHTPARRPASAARAHASGQTWLPAGITA